MNGQFQSQAMAYQQQAGMIGAGMPLSDSIVGGGINRTMAIGGPMASLGLGLAGLDPISMGIRGAGMGARFGMGGAMAGGLAAGGIAMGGAMAAGYAVNQFAQGAQQQQQFGQMMNSTFRFANNNGSTGFGRSGLGDIGSSMRQMTTEQGPMGQMVGFEELGRLASNMGRMGMAQGIRDAKEFSEKFREMVKTVKQIAESMGTSLEEAQKMMGAMRSSGVFGQNQAAQFASRVRLGAQAGGMATSELTGMMQVGSQISRMVGGRGRAGAAGGLETITNIGVAQQMGLISEEDIYNTTGLTGAEGRRAMATRQMEQSAQFLRGSLGRRFLASVAGKDGTLDEGSVSRYMSGGVGTEDTIDMYNRNLSKVGRANFIRNEGKLRGAALEKFGGLVPMIAMKNWLDERGINANEDNDRAMIFMQRQLGMGNDESEMMLRQVRELPQLMRQRKNAGEDDSYMRRIQERNSHTGLEGVKHKFDKAKAEVNAVLEQAGADFYSSMSSTVDGFINRLTDTYVKETRADVANAFRTMSGGGAMGASAAADTFGVGKKFKSAASFKGLLGEGPSDISIFQQGDASRFASAGFAMKGNDITGHLAKVSQITGAFRGGAAGLQDRTEIAMAGAGAAAAFRQSVMNGEVAGKGMDRLESFGTFLRGQAGLGGLADQYARASDVEKAQIMATFTGKGGADLDQAGYFQDPGLKGVYGVTGQHTLGEGAEAVGDAFMGLGKGGVSRRGGLLNAFTAARDAKKVGKYLTSEGGRATIEKMMSDSSETRAAARDSVEREIISLKDKENRSSEEDGRLKGLQGLLMSQKLTELEVNGASQEQLDAEAARLGKEHGLSVDEVKSQVATIGALAERNRTAAQGAAGERYGERARADILGLQSSGLVTGSGDNLTLRAAAADKLGGGSAGKAFLTAMVEKQKAMAKMGPGADNAALMSQANASGQLMSSNLAGMSVAEQRQLASGLSGVSGAEDAAEEVGMVAGVSSQLEKGGKQGGLARVAGMLGSNLSKEELAKIIKTGGASGAAKAIASSIGGGLDKNTDFMKDLEASLGSVQAGKFGEAGQKLTGLLGNETVSKARVAAANDADPNFHLKGIAEHSKNMAASLVTAVNELSAINKSTTKSAEDWL